MTSAASKARELIPDVRLRAADPHTRLATYLNDHLGGSATGIELARRTLARNRGNEYGVALERIVHEIEEDRQALLELMARLDVKPDRLKESAGWAMEKLGRLKPNGQLLGYSPLSRLIELEALMLGISGKLAMWVVVRRVLANDPRIDGIDLDRLADRAREQRKTVELLRRRASFEALR